MSLLSSRFMLNRSSNARSLSSTVAAFAVLVLAATRAEAGHAVSALEGQPLHILAASNPSGTAAERMSLSLNSLDVEKAFGSDSTTGGVAVSSTASAPSVALNSLPASGEVNPSSTGQLRARELFQVMSDLPQVGSPKRNAPAGALEFWDDASSARSTVDDRATGAADIAAQASGRSGQQNVMIPLPPAAMSGLSVLAALALVGGVRRLTRGLA